MNMIKLYYEDKFLKNIISWEKLKILYIFSQYYFEFLKRAFMSTTIIKAKNKATTPTTIKEV